LIGYCVEGSLFLVYEFIENGNLSQHLRGSGETTCPFWTFFLVVADTLNGSDKSVACLQRRIHCHGLQECKLPLIQLEALNTSMSILSLFIFIVILNRQTSWSTRTSGERLDWFLSWWCSISSFFSHICIELYDTGCRFWINKTNWGWKYITPYTSCGYIWIHAARVRYFLF